MPYIIGLTGSTASGKSALCARLQRLGAAVIDCDKLGHKSYEPGTDTYHEVLAAFGQDLVTSDGHIDRRRLAGRVFSNKDDLEKLNSIVWPAIQRLAKQEIAAAANNGEHIVVLDAAVLLEAGWDQIVHEVWTTVIPRDEAVKRLVERNKLSAEEATRRFDAQMSNAARVGRANVVLCTLWHPDVTQKQVEKAWHLLQTRIGRK